MNRRRIAICLLVAIACCMRSTFAQGADPVIVRTSLEPDEAVMVGQRVVLKIDVLASEGWANLPTRPTVETPGAIVYSPSSQGLRLTETVDGASYTGQRTELWVFPQRAGKLTIPSLSIDVDVKQFGLNAEPKMVPSKTKPLELEVSLPPDAPSDDVISAEELTASQTWRPDLKELKVGDGLERSVERVLGGAPGLVLPPVRWDAPSGVRVYEKQPQLSESSNRGELTSRRTDTATYVFEKPGDFALPDMKVVWWDTTNKKWQEQALPGLEISVAPAASSEEQDASGPVSENERGRSGIFGWAVVGVLSLLVGWLLWSGTLGTQWLSDRVESAQNSEWYRFREFRRAAERNDPRSALRELVCWLDMLELPFRPARLDQFLKEYGAPSDCRLGWELVEAANGDTTNWNGHSLVTAVQAARSKLAAANHQSVKSGQLPRLNPQVRHRQT